MNRRTWLGVGAVLLGSASGCGFSSGGGDNGEDAAVVDAAPLIPDAPTDPRDFSWTIGTDEQFNTGTTIAGGFVANDRLEPHAWADGYLLTFGSADTLFDDGDDAGEIAAAVFGNPSFTGPILSNPTNLQYGNQTPLGLGIPAGDVSWTVWSEGQIWLEKNAHQFKLTCSDRCYFGVSLDNGLTYSAVVTGNDSQASRNIAVPADGFYPVRYAISNGDAGAASELLHDPPGTAGEQPLSRWRLRYPVTAAPAASMFNNMGLIQTGFENGNTVSPIGDVLRTTSVINEDYTTGVPTGLGIADGDNWTQRLAGQLWIEVGGIYRFSYAADDDYRISIDNFSRMGEIDLDGSTEDIQLSRGWHDLRIEQGDRIGNAQLRFKVEAVPTMETGLVVGEPIPASRLRPVITGRERLTATRVVIEDSSAQQNADHTIWLDLPSDATSTQFFAGYDLEVDANEWSLLTNNFDVPGSVTNLMFPAQPDSEEDDDSRRDISVAALASTLGGATGGAWNLHLETSGESQFLLRELGVSARFTGGPESIAALTTFVSPVKDAERPVKLSALTMDAGAPEGSNVTVELRVCTTNPCTSEPWMPAADVATNQPIGQFFQIRAALTSDGIAVPFLDTLKLEGRDAE